MKPLPTCHRSSSDVPRRTFLKIAGAAALGCVGGYRSVDAGAAEPASFSFVHMTDIHVQPELDAEKGLQQCLATINRLDPRPDFAITGGDLVMDSLAVGQDRLKVQWEIFDRSIKNLELPVHHTIGNHDVVGWSRKAVIQPDAHEYGKAIFAERYGQGQTYRSFDHKGWRFIQLDSIGQAADSPDYIGLIDDQQLDWLKNELEKAGKSIPIVIITHIPVYSTWDQVIGGSQRPTSAQSLVTNAHILRKVLKPFNVKLVLSGHGHIRERIETDHQVHIQSGAVCGNWWRGRINGDAEAFGVVNCTSDDFSYRYREFGWTATKA